MAQLKNARLSKRVQVDKTQAMMLGVAIAASFISVFALVAAKTYFSQANYLNRVAAKKEAAVKQLKTNEQAASTLVTSYKSFSAQNPNLTGGIPTGTGERDGDNGRLILDALPSKYDFPALATSLEKLLTGYTINSISGTDDVATNSDSAAATNAKAVDMPFSLDVSTDYKGLQTLITTFEKSIRPFQVLSLEIGGTNSTLKANISAKTYYQPARDLKVTSEVVK